MARSFSCRFCDHSFGLDDLGGCLAVGCKCIHDDRTTFIVKKPKRRSPFAEPLDEYEAAA